MKKLPAIILTDERINALSEGAENLLYHMVIAADGYGRLIDSMQVILITCYPRRVMTTRTIARRIKELQDANFLTKIVIEGRPLLEIIDYDLFNINRTDRQKLSILGSPKGITSGITNLDKPNPEVKDFIRYWGQVWPTKVGNGHPYPFSYGKEGKIIKEMLRTIPLKELQEYTIKFLESTDQFTKNTGWTIGSFKMSIARLLSHKEDGSWKETFSQMDLKSSPLTLESQIAAIGGPGR